MKNSIKKLMILALLGYQFSGYVMSASTDGLKESLPTVNGIALSSSVFKQRLESELAVGQKDTPQLRAAIIQDMLNRHLLVAEALRLGVDKQPEVQQRLVALREDLLIEKLFKDSSSGKEITESEIRAEYERQIQLLGPIDQTKEYQLSLIVLPSVDAARSTITDIQKGALFDEIARKVSIDPSKANGGRVGWVLPQVINPLVANVMLNLPKGVITTNPVQIQSGWAVFKIDDVRYYKAPSFEDSKERIAAGLIQRSRSELLEKIKSKAVIKP